MGYGMTLLHMTTSQMSQSTFQFDQLPHLSGINFQYRYIYYNFNPVNDWRLRESSQCTAKKCIESIESLIKTKSVRLQIFIINSLLI